MQLRTAEICSNVQEMTTSHTRRSATLGIRTSVPVLVRGRLLPVEISNLMWPLCIVMNVWSLQPALMKVMPMIP